MSASYRRSSSRITPARRELVAFSTGKPNFGAVATTRRVAPACVPDTRQRPLTAITSRRGQTRVANASPEDLYHRLQSLSQHLRSRCQRPLTTVPPISRMRCHRLGELVPASPESLPASSDDHVATHREDADAQRRPPAERTDETSRRTRTTDARTGGTLGRLPSTAGRGRGTSLLSDTPSPEWPTRRRPSPPTRPREQLAQASLDFPRRT